MPGASKKLVYLSALAVVAMHVMPVGLVQFADYVSDIFIRKIHGYLIAGTLHCSAW